MVVRGNKELTVWIRLVLVNGAEVTALLDTGCTKSVVHPRCIREKVNFRGTQHIVQLVLNRFTYLQPGLGCRGMMGGAMRWL